MKHITKEIIESKGFTFYGDKTLLEFSPEKQAGIIEFFKLYRYVSDDELEKEYKERGLIPLDVDTILIDKDILDKKRYIATHWKDTDGKWCFATFRRWDGDERDVSVDRRSGGDWNDCWWFAGLRKGAKSLKSKSSALDSLELRVSTLESKLDKVLEALK